MRSNHIYARAFCRALLEHSENPEAWHAIAIIGERLGIRPDEGIAVARECARRTWIDYAGESVRLSEEGRRIARQRLSFRRDAGRKAG